MTLGVYVPTLGRPHRLQALVDNIEAVTETPYEVVFVTEPHDEESFDAAIATGALAVVNEGEPSYSNSLQAAYELYDHRYFIGANDDFVFQPGWDTEALTVMRSLFGEVGCGTAARSIAARTRRAILTAPRWSMPGRRQTNSSPP